jgi:tRNA threonylcarbamoyladenosine biosynthesis protein TsaE
MKVFSNIGIDSYKEILIECNLLFSTTKNLKIITLSGEMGAGKTTFARKILENWNVRGFVNSPTFSLMNEYDLPSGKSVYHFDLYRIQNISELEDLGFESIWKNSGLSIIEWWEKADCIIPYPRLNVNLQLSSLETRNIKIEIQGSFH